MQIYILERKTVERILLFLAITLGLIGCASMTPQEYTQIAQYEIWIRGGTEKGVMSPEVAGKGMYYLQENLQGKNHDKEKLAAERRLWAERNLAINRENCNTVASQIYGREAASAAPVYTQPIYQPRQTYCNRIGSQVFCNTY